MTTAAEFALVTGASGFIGRHVVAHLRGLGIPVTTMGRTPPAQTAAGITFERADAADLAQITAVVGRVRPTLILHLAGAAPGGDAASTYLANTVFAANILTAAHSQAYPPAVLLAGSAAEYGPSNNVSGARDETMPCHPDGVYGISKLAQTMHGIAAAAKGLPVDIARLFNVIGAGMPRHLALGEFTAQILAMPKAGGALRPRGSLLDTRDYVEAEPTAAALVQLVRNPSAFGQIINICSGVPNTLEPYVEALIIAASKPVTIVHAEAEASPRSHIFGRSARLSALGYHLPPADPMRVARAAMNWSPAR